MCHCIQYICRCTSHLRWTQYLKHITFPEIIPLLVAVQMTVLVLSVMTFSHSFTWSSSNDQLFSTADSADTHWPVTTFSYNLIHCISYSSHELALFQTLQRLLAQPFLHIRSFCILPQELNERLDGGKAAGPPCSYSLLLPLALLEEWIRTLDV